jgi:hypothetical protein
VPIGILPALAIGSGALVGLVLGLVGGGGSILAVPLLVYVVGVSSPHVAIGTTAIVVALSPVELRIAVWTGDARDTRPNADIHVPPLSVGSRSLSRSSAMMVDGAGNSR